MSFGDGEALCSYLLGRLTSRLALATFRNGVHIVNPEHVPKPGSATILCYNHAGHLCDPITFWGGTPRMVRVVAKATLMKGWTGIFMRWSGAVPVMRKEDLPPGTTVDNSKLFAKIVEALERGFCIGTSPEGNSKFRTFICDPFAMGPANFAIEAVVKRALNDGDEGFEVNILPTGLTYAGLENWRSACMIRYAKPIVVDAARLRAAGMTTGTSTRGEEALACAKAITAELRAAMQQVAVHVPPLPDSPDTAAALEGDFGALRRGVVATRLAFFDGSNDHLPPIDQWFDVVEVLGNQLKDMTSPLALRVSQYHRALVQHGLRDAQVRGGHGKCGAVCCIMFQLPLLLLALVLALPGVVLWSPTFLVSLMHQPQVVRKGKAYNPEGTLIRRRANYDTISTVKIAAGFFFICLEIGVATAMNLVAWILGCPESLALKIIVCLPGFIFVPLLLWISMRLLEEASALARSMSGAKSLCVVKDAVFKDLQAKRAALREEVLTIQGLDLARRERNGNCAGCWLGRKLNDWHEAMDFNADRDLEYLGLYELPEVSGEYVPLAG